MRFKGLFKRVIVNEDGYPEISFSVNKTNALDELKNMKDIPLTIDVKKASEKRSLNANAYYWVLANEIAKTMSSKNNRPFTALDIYREHIRDVGAFYIIPVKQSEIERFESIWKSKGEGWLVEDMGNSKLTGYEILRCYYGSSSYSTEEMSRLIDLCVADAKELGISTLTPEELEEIKSYEERTKDRDNKDK